MIVSHRHRFIFLKTTKTAGTSFEIALSRICGPDDIITANADEDEELRRSLGYPGPQHSTWPLKHYDLKDWLKLIRRRKKIYAHIPGVEVRKLVGEEVWKSYFKFCFVRNPWDRVISNWHWMNRDGELPPLAAFLESEHIPKMQAQGLGIYTIDGQVVVDQVCRFENIQAEFEAIMAKFGQTGPLPPLPRAKGGVRKDKRHYRDVIGPAERDRIHELFKTEIERYGYTF